MPKTFDVIIHGARADQADLREAVAWARGLGHVVRAHVTWEAGDAERFAAAAARGGADAGPPNAVIAVGGDGTVNDVVNGLAGTQVPLGILPAGTANDFARQTGVPDDARAAMALVLDTEPVTVDLGELNGRRFLNMSSAGLGAETTAHTPAAAKAVLGPLAYALTGVKKLAVDYAPQRARFVGPDFDVEAEFVLFAVGNARATGGGTTITPLADVTDGLLDLCVVEPMARTEFTRLLPTLRRGEHLEREGVRYAQVPWLRVEAAEPVHVNLDGEALQVTRFEYRVHPGALRVHAAHLPGAGDGELLEDGVGSVASDAGGEP